MLKVLVNAYACNPDMGSEQGMGWKWILCISEFCEVYVTTESEYKAVNLKAINSKDFSNVNAKGLYVNEYGLTSEQCKRIHFYFVNVGNNENDCSQIRKMCWNQGTWSFYPKYAKWQEKVLNVAFQIIDEQEKTGHGIDVMHQLNMAGFREPGMLYKVNDQRRHSGKKRIPLVWGPMTGYDHIPFPFMLQGGIKFASFYLLKNVLNLVQLVGHHRVRKMIKNADKLIAATPEMKLGIEQFYNVDVEHINETGCETSNAQDTNKRSIDSGNENLNKFKIIWVGRFIYTKQLGLALKTIQRIKNLNIEFLIVGRAFDDVDTENMHEMARQLGINDICVWHGQIPHDEVFELMTNSDLFFFTSIFEGTSTVIMEAIQCGLPIVCFNRCGFGPIVDEEIGIRIPCSNPRMAIKDFSNAISYLYNNRNILEEMKRNCCKKQYILSWDYKISRLKQIYESL